MQFICNVFVAIVKKKKVGVVACKCAKRAKVECKYSERYKETVSR